MKSVVPEAGPWFNIKMSSYQYRKSHCGDKTIVRLSYLHNGISYTGKMSSLYWIGALVSRSGVNDYIPQYMWDVISCPCHWYPHKTTETISPGMPGSVSAGMAVCPGMFGTTLSLYNSGLSGGQRHLEPQIGAFDIHRHNLGGSLTVHKIHGLCAEFLQNTPQVCSITTIQQIVQRNNLTFVMILKGTCLFCN